jgi:putative GTP pyrophosphokinase
MTSEISHEDFCKRNGISDESWISSGCTWDELKAIGVDHAAQLSSLEKAAELLAKSVQTIPGVHSVRWRVKEVEHLLEKIVRKRSAGEEKYKAISVENYNQVVHDLVGVRALHLFKDDTFSINSSVADAHKVVGKPIAYIREGDRAELTAKFEAAGFRVENHSKGYRSIHYTIESSPFKRVVFAELQVRTIFEEGWSEIDHRVRYPHFSDDPLVGFFLTIFNRLAGSADDMGTFVQGLAASQSQMRDELAREKREKDLAVDEMARLLETLDQFEKQDLQSKEAKERLARQEATIEKLKAEVAKLQKPPVVPPVFDPYSATGGISGLARLAQGYDDATLAELAASQLRASNSLWALTNNLAAESALTKVLAEEQRLLKSLGNKSTLQKAIEDQELLMKPFKDQDRVRSTLSELNALSNPLKPRKPGQ